MMHGDDKANKPDRGYLGLGLGMAIVYFLHQLDKPFLNKWLPLIVLVVAASMFAYTFAPVKEFVRKRIVGLKRQPQLIPLVVLAIAFIYYSFNLTIISNTTAYVQGVGMGLAGFAIMLLSVLLLVCLLNAYPRRQKPKALMLGVMYAMIGCVFVSSFVYTARIDEAIQNNHYRGAFEHISAEIGEKRTTEIRNAVIDETIKDANYLKQYGIKVRNSKELEKVAADAKLVVDDAAAREKAAHDLINAVYDPQVAAIVAEETDAMLTNAAFARKHGENAMPAIYKLAPNGKLSGVTMAALEKEGIVFYDVDRVNELRTPGEDGQVPEQNAREADRLVAAGQKKFENMLSDAQKLFKRMKQNVAKRTAVFDKPWQAELNAATDQAWTEAVNACAFAETYGVDLDGMKIADARRMITAAANLTAPQPSPEALYLEAKASNINTSIMSAAEVAGKATSDKVLKERPFIMQTRSAIGVHRILLLVGAALALLLPVYAPLIRKIKTSVEVEANENMGEIELDNSDN